MHIGRAIKAHMALKGVRQSDLADALGRHKNSISRKLANPDWPWSDIELFAGIIGIDPESVIETAKSA